MAWEAVGGSNGWSLLSVIMCLFCRSVWIQQLLGLSVGIGECGIKVASNEDVVRIVCAICFSTKICQ